MADTADLKSAAERRPGSSPGAPIKGNMRYLKFSNRKHGGIVDWRMFGQDWYFTFAWPGYRKPFEFQRPRRLKRLPNGND